jgi:hypothetical protein
VVVIPSEVRNPLLAVPYKFPTQPGPVKVAGAIRDQSIGKLTISKRNEPMQRLLGSCLRSVVHSGIMVVKMISRKRNHGQRDIGDSLKLKGAGAKRSGEIAPRKYIPPQIHRDAGGVQIPDIFNAAEKTDCSSRNGTSFTH